MPVFTDAPRLDFRQGNGVSSFQAQAKACGSRPRFCSARHTVEWSMVSRKSRFAVSATMVMWSCAAYARTQDPSWGLQEDRVASRRQVEELPRNPMPPNDTDAQAPQEQTLNPQWLYGGFLDSAYLLDFNHPANDLFRSRGTAYKVDEPILNMAVAYLRKPASESSRWGMEFTLQGGQDTRIFGFSATAPNLAGSEWLRHLGPADISYLVPVGKGLTVQAGIFSSFIGYDSL